MPDAACAHQLLTAAASSSTAASTAAKTAAADGDIWDDSEVVTKEDDSEVFKPDGRARPKYVEAGRRDVSAVTTALFLQV